MEKGISNFSVLCGHKTMPHAMATLLRSGDIRIDGFLCPGHVSVIIGSEAYTFMPGQFHIPCVIAGFEPGDMLQAIRLLLQQTVEGRAEVENQYQRSVNRTGNPAAQALMQEVFEPAASVWRGLGEIPGSGLKIRPAFAACDAAKRFSGLSLPSAIEPQGCRCGDILRGVCLPLDCPLFGQACTPHRPIGACMVSSEGTCAAYYRYGGVHA
jgi:hydrogenase expression/formation protein HypD